MLPPRGGPMPARGFPNGASAADAETLDKRLVAPFIFVLDVVQQGAPLRDHLQQAATRVVILDMALEMAGEVRDPLSQDRHLHLWRTGVAGLQRIVPDERGFALRGYRHRVSFQWRTAE